MLKYETFSRTHLEKQFNEDNKDFSMYAKLIWLEFSSNLQNGLQISGLDFHKLANISRSQYNTTFQYMYI